MSMYTFLIIVASIAIFLFISMTMSSHQSLGEIDFEIDESFRNRTDSKSTENHLYISTIADIYNLDEDKLLLFLLRPDNSEKYDTVSLKHGFAVMDGKGLVDDFKHEFGLDQYRHFNFVTEIDKICDRLVYSDEYVGNGNAIPKVSEDAFALLEKIRNSLLIPQAERVVLRRVVCSAMRNENGQIVIGPRHFDSVMRATIDLIATTEEAKESWYKAESGFIDQWGVYMTRQEAWVVATVANQIVNRCGGDQGTLFSENLY